MVKFESEAMQLHRRIHVARKENRFLAELRDALLPKLMSGQVRIKDAEKVVEDAI
jgi:type I restriction enzyme S subunit